MARGDSDGSRRGGGAGIQAPRPGRARVATGGVALLAAIGLAVYPAAQDIRLQPLALGLAVAGVFVLTLGLAARSAWAIGFALVALGGTYAVLFAAEGGRLDRVAPAYAAGLLLVAELAFWSIESRVPAWADPELVIWRLARLALACAGAAVLGAIVVADAAAASGGGGLLLETLGVAAVIGALVLVTVLLRRHAEEPDAAQRRS